MDRELTPEEQILISMFIECSNGATDLGKITYEYLGMDMDLFNSVLDMMNNKGYLVNYRPARAAGKTHIPFLEEGVVLSDRAMEKAQKILESFELPNGREVESGNTIFGGLKEDFKDLLAKYLAEMSK